ncbi:hypothetical protein TU75_12910 [Pseudomonas poae]|uniref:Uncharacterized protein n=1 Tax=Pseudomonas poae TaxID=200451 RepID=A0ABY0RED0_9PSED|nr:hypothetical protein TU75_12910 [Pseudomonas poae]SDN83989.1 hypothetical protein SAMN04490208_1646 [Pseudomonas poae]
MVLIANAYRPDSNIPCKRKYLTLCERECGRVNAKVVSTAQSRTQLQKQPALGTSRVFMLTHGKEVRRVSFFQSALKALFVMAFRMVGKVSFLVRSGYFLTFISVKYSIY